MIIYLSPFGYCVVGCICHSLLISTYVVFSLWWSMHTSRRSTRTYYDIVIANKFEHKFQIYDASVKLLTKTKCMDRIEWNSKHQRYCVASIANTSPVVLFHVSMRIREYKTYGCVRCVFTFIKKVIYYFLRFALAEFLITFRINQCELAAWLVNEERSWHKQRRKRMPMTGALCVDWKLHLNGVIISRILCSQAKDSRSANSMPTPINVTCIIENDKKKE